MTMEKSNRGEVCEGVNPTSGNLQCHHSESETEGPCVASFISATGLKDHNIQSRRQMIDHISNRSLNQIYTTGNLLGHSPSCSPPCHISGIKSQSPTCDYDPSPNVPDQVCEQHNAHKINQDECTSFRSPFSSGFEHSCSHLRNHGLHSISSFNRGNTLTCSSACGVDNPVNDSSHGQTYCHSHSSTLNESNTATKSTTRGLDNSIDTPSLACNLSHCLSSNLIGYIGSGHSSNYSPGAPCSASNLECHLNQPTDTPNFSYCHSSLPTCSHNTLHFDQSNDSNSSTNYSPSAFVPNSCFNSSCLDSGNVLKTNCPTCDCLHTYDHPPDHDHPLPAPQEHSPRCSQDHGVSSSAPASGDIGLRTSEIYGAPHNHAHSHRLSHTSHQEKNVSSAQSQTCNQPPDAPQGAPLSFNPEASPSHFCEGSKIGWTPSPPSFPNGCSSRLSVHHAFNSEQYSESTTVYCSEHDGREMELYCKACEQPICLRCVIKGNKHYLHEYEEIANASKRMKRKIIRTSLQPAESQLLSATDLLKEIDSRRKEISKQERELEASIEFTFAKCKRDLDARKEELILCLHKVVKGKLSALGAQQYRVEATQVKLGSTVGSMRKNLSIPNNKTKLLLMRSSLPHNVGSSMIQPSLLKPVIESDMTFSFPDDFSAQCSRVGKVWTSSSPDPSKCYLTKKSRERLVSVLNKGTAILQVVDYDGKPCKNVIKSVESEFVSEIAKTVMMCDVEKSWRQGQYRITYQPSTKGKHQLRVKVEGQHIQGSPFSIIAKTPVEDLGIPVLTLSNLRSPRGVAINHNGEIIIAEEDACCISIFISSGKKVQSFGIHGSRDGQFKSPRAVAVDGQGNIIVADSDNYRIQKFSPTGQFIAASKTVTANSTCLLHSSGVAYNPVNQKIYVVDINQGIYIFDADNFSMLSVFGEKGKGQGQLLSPWNITCDSTGNVYVADTGNHRIQVFTAEGKYLRKFGTQGTKEGELSWPDGIAVHDGMVYVSEYRNHRISVFTCEGQFVHSFGGNGENSGELKDPFGLTVDNNGLIYVCDSGNNRVQVF